MRRTAREVARRVLRRVDQGAYATLALAGELGRAELSDADRALATELVYGVLRRRPRLDRALAAQAPRGLDKLDQAVRDALRVGAYQILFLRVPAHAAVDDAVGAVKRLRGARLGGFVNALLRRLAEAGEPPLPEAPRERLAIAHSAPAWLVDLALRRFDDEEAARFLAALDAPAPTWLRANTLRADRDTVARRLAAERGGAAPTFSPHAPEALALAGGGDPSRGRAFAEGLVAVQDLGAQLCARLVEPAAGEVLLDACAGVGGKSAHLAALAGNAAEIDAADASARKLELCADQARRLGVAGLRTVAADLTRADAPLRPVYDRILLDAPCSGLGVLRRHPEAKWRAPHQAVPALAATQAELLARLAPRVRPGGLLVYSVCTFTEEEGREQVARFLAAHPGFRLEPPADAALAALAPDGRLETWPHRHDADAFFAARLRRVG